MSNLELQPQVDQSTQLAELEAIIAGLAEREAIFHRRSSLDHNQQHDVELSEFPTVACPTFDCPTLDCPTDSAAGCDTFTTSEWCGETITCNTAGCPIA